MSGFQCGACKRYSWGWSTACRGCGRVGYLSGSHAFDRVDVASVRNLLSNLAIAGALTRSFRLGDLFGFDMGATAEQRTGHEWSPNTRGRAAGSPCDDPQCSCRDTDDDEDDRWSAGPEPEYEGDDELAILRGRI